MLTGCGGDGSQPAPVTQSQTKQARQDMAGYREQLTSQAKSQAKASAKGTTAEKR
jgi:hypothetical protein